MGNGEQRAPGSDDFNLSGSYSVQPSFHTERPAAAEPCPARRQDSQSRRCARRMSLGGSLAYRPCEAMHEGRTTLALRGERMYTRDIEHGVREMSGTRLGRGRGGRLAVYGGCGLVVVLLVFLYRAATLEMTRLRELHVQCVHQQEALAAQLQVIFEYKVRLEKSLAEEKSSNAAVKQELQQRASREKSLRDKDSVEAMQRFNSLQQTYKLLQTEHQDLQDECKKREKQALEDSNTLETTLQDLRSRIRKMQEDKEKSLEFKNKYLELESEKTKLEDKYNEMLKSNGNTGSTIEHLKKEVFQLKRELIEAKRGQRATSPAASLVTFTSSQPRDQQRASGKSMEQPILQPSALQHQQVSRPSNDDESPQPIHAPRSHHAIGDPLSIEPADEQLANDLSNVGFAQKGGSIVPVGADDLAAQQDQRNSLPIPYDLREKRQKGSRPKEEQEEVEEEEAKQVIPPPNGGRELEKFVDRKASSKVQNGDEFDWNSRNNEALPRPDDKSMMEAPDRARKADEDELQKLQGQIEGILDQSKQ
ncbi:hypothetical protein KM043_012570 [Ampulex compressa]|nr:hypothetical protein KM043_012570 [Ampulex compressa]